MALFLRSVCYLVSNPNPEHDMRTLVSALLLVVCFASFAVAQPPAEPPAQLPDFIFTQTNGIPYLRANLKPNKATVVMLFDPGCDHCQAQATLIKQAASRLQNVQFVFVSIDEATYVNAFREQYLAGAGLDMVFLLDKAFKFDSYFSRSPIPSLFVYGADNRLRGFWKNEEVPIQDILDAIQ